jgi:hypothetical protein
VGLSPEDRAKNIWIEGRSPLNAKIHRICQGSETEIAVRRLPIQGTQNAFASKTRKYTLPRLRTIPWMHNTCWFQAAVEGLRRALEYGGVDLRSQEEPVSFLGIALRALSRGDVRLDSSPCELIEVLETAVSGQKAGDSYFLNRIFDVLHLITLGDDLLFNAFNSKIKKTGVCLPMLVAQSSWQESVLEAFLRLEKKRQSTPDIFFSYSPVESKNDNARPHLNVWGGIMTQLRMYTAMDFILFLLY